MNLTHLASREDVVWGAMANTIDVALDCPSRILGPK
jgi:hypothetical protein